MARINPEINAGSMADIAFLLLIFFLVTTTMDVDKGLLRMLPPPPDPDVEGIETRERNVFPVLTDQYDRVAIRGLPIDLRDLREMTKEHIQNRANDPNKPEEVFEEIDGLGVVRRTRYVISLQTDRTTSYELYVSVQNELAAAINELRDEYSRSRFQKPFSELTDQVIVDGIARRLYPMAISEAEPVDIGAQRRTTPRPRRR